MGCTPAKFRDLENSRTVFTANSRKLPAAVIAGFGRVLQNPVKAPNKAVDSPITGMIDKVSAFINTPSLSTNKADDGLNIPNAILSKEMENSSEFPKEASEVATNDENFSGGLFKRHKLVTRTFESKITLKSGLNLESIRLENKEYKNQTEENSFNTEELAIQGSMELPRRSSIGKLTVEPLEIVAIPTIKDFEDYDEIAKAADRNENERRSTLHKEQEKAVIIAKEMRMEEEKNIDSTKNLMNHFQGEAMKILNKYKGN